MDATLLAFLKTGTPTVWHAVEIIYPDFTLRLTDAGTVTINGDVFSSEDEDYGSLGAVSEIGDGETGEARTVTIGLKPPTTAALADLIDPEAQLSRVTVWWGGVDPETGDVVGEPEGVAVGYLDTARVIMGETKREIEVEVIMADDYALEAREGQNLSPAFLRSIDPTAAGLDHVTGVTQRDYWGGSPPGGGFISRLAGNVPNRASPNVTSAF